MGLGTRAVLDRKALFFTIAASILVAVLFVVLSIGLREQRIDTGLYTAQVAEQTRQRIEGHYLPTVLRFTAYENLQALASDAIANDYLTLPDNFSHAMNGTYGRPLSSQDLQTRYDELATAIDIAGLGDIDFTVRTVTISQVGTFFADAIATTNYTYTSRDGSVRFNRSVTTIARVLLTNIPDPLYTREIGTARTFTIFTQQAWNDTEFERLWSEGSYAPDPNRGPGIFARLQGSTTPDVFGVMSLIPDGTAIPNNRTSIDSEYARAVNEECRYTRPGTTLRLNYTRGDLFNITGLDHVGAPGSCPPPPSP